LSGPHTSIDFFGVAWRLGATLFFVALNGFFVAAEFALVKVREPRIAQLGRDGSLAAPSVQHILRHLDRYLSACQLGITLASLILGALGEPAVSVLLIAGAEAVGLPVDEEASWVPVVSITLAFTLITVLHMTVGEQAPKMWALRRAEKLALTTAPPLRGFTWLFRPFIQMINWISNRLLQLIGLSPELGLEPSHSTEEIRSILSLSARAGKISDHEYELSENVFRIIDLEVRHIVVPRIEVDFLIASTPLEQNLEHIRTNGHSRFALCELGLDTIIGIVHSRDVLDAVLRGETPDLRAIARPPVFVSDTMSISNFLRELQQHRQQCAVVLDEHGTAIGLAFREDALEEIVGPLGDEFDEEDPDFIELPDGIYEVSGRMPLPELEDRLHFELPEEEGEEEDTIGGHVTARLGRLPKKGDSVRVGPYLATVIDTSRRRAHKLQVTLAEPSPTQDAAGEDSYEAT